MEYLTAILLLLPVHFAVMVSPGPNFVLLSTTALMVDRATAVQAAFGIATGSLIWMIAAALGISVILETLPVLGWVLKIVGGVYLIYLGIKLWRSAAKKTDDVISEPNSSVIKGFRRGLLVNLTSPKSAAYFGSIFAAFLSNNMPIWVIVLLISAFFMVSIAWHVALAVVFSTETVRKPYTRFSSLINRVSGSVLILFGGRLISDVR
ncbi:MAG: LysE family transporter [Pseudomonadota bacterium]